ncbi:glycoside-pentoside-hexuronide (GPH):cation symporter [Mycoplasmatota bacterium WC44]
MVNNKVKLVYGLGGLGKNMMFAMSVIMFVYFTDYVEIDPIIIGLIFLGVRIWDAVNDPIMGNIVDNTNTRWGKFRPWILIGAILNCVILLIIYSRPDLPINSKQQIIFITVFYTLWGMTYTLMDIPFWALIPALSKDAKERLKLSSIARVFTNIGLFLIAASYPVVVKFLGGGDSPSEELDGFFILACIVSGIFFITQLLVVGFVREKKQQIKNKITFKKTIEVLFKNDQLLVVIMVIVVFNLVLYITSGMAFYFFQYDLNNENLFVVFVALGGIVQVISSATYPILSKYLNRKKIFQLSIITPIIGCIGLLVYSFGPKDNIYGLMIFGFLVFYGIGISMVMQTILLSDSVEYGEWKINERTEGVVFSVQTFTVKLANALAMGLIGVGLGLFSFKAGEIQLEKTLIGMRLMMFALPIVGLLIALLIYNKFFKLDEEMYEKVVKELHEREQIHKTI